MTHTLGHELAFQARQRGGGLAVWGPGGPVSYQALVRDVDGLATELMQGGLTRQDLVGLEMGISYLHLLLILALDRLGIASMSFTAPGQVPATATALATFGLTAIVSAEPAPSGSPVRWITMAERDRPTFEKPDAARLAALPSTPDDLVRVIWSSGTTGGVKGSPVTRTVQRHRVANRRIGRGFGPRTRYFAGMPFSTAPGYARLIAVLAAGGTVVLPCPPMDFVGLANAAGVTVTSASPALLADLLGRSGTAVRCLETMAYFEIHGDHLPGKLVQDARRFLTPNLWINYGSTECDAVSTADATVCIADPSAVGFVSPWVDVEIVDETDEVLPEGEEGWLRLRGEQVVTSYYKNDPATRRNFRGGWFYPGDRAVLAAQGMLRITGRAADAIVRDGVSLSPLPIEAQIRAIAGVRDVAVFALPGPTGVPDTCAALVLEPGTDVARLRVDAAARLGADLPTRLFVIDKLPRNPNGKVLRRELVALAERSIKA